MSSGGQILDYSTYSITFPLPSLPVNFSALRTSKRMVLTSSMLSSPSTYETVVCPVYYIWSHRHCKAASIIKTFFWHWHTYYRQLAAWMSNAANWPCALIPLHCLNAYCSPFFLVLSDICQLLLQKLDMISLGTSFTKIANRSMLTWPCEWSWSEKLHKVNCKCRLYIF